MDRLSGRLSASGADHYSLGACIFQWRHASRCRSRHRRVAYGIMGVFLPAASTGSAAKVPRHTMSELRPKVVDLSTLKVACTDCALYELCLPPGLGDADLERLDHIIRRRKPVKRGVHLFNVGDPFRMIYALRSGSVKTYTVVGDGREQITGFYLPGELLGLDAISSGIHPCGAKTLETTSVCEIPFNRLQQLSENIPGLQKQLYRIMSKEISQEQSMLMLLGKRTVEERLAAFLLSLSTRFYERGFSSSEFNLSMSRHEIGNYLGMAVETVSRTFTRFQEEGLIEAERKRIRLRDLKGLCRVAGTDHPCPRGAVVS